MIEVEIDYDHRKLTGKLSVPEEDSASPLWDRLKQSASQSDDYRLSRNSISVPWPSLLSILREYVPLQRRMEFAFRPTSSAKPLVEDFVAQMRTIKQAQGETISEPSQVEIESRLISLGFTKRSLKPFQLRDLRKLLSLHNGANFSVPGAGKTTVTFALHLLTRTEGQKLLVVGPKSSFPAWHEVVEDCISEDAPSWAKEPFTLLTGGPDAVRQGFESNASRFIINYEQLISSSSIFMNFLSKNKVHLILDESHRMKGGLSVKRGVVLMNSACLPVRRDILSGTPMPHSPSDLKSQLDFLWPGSGLGHQVSLGASPREVISTLYVRTTKADLGLPKVDRHYKAIEMGRGQSALYGIVRSEALRSLSSLRAGSGVDIPKARRSVMRLLQLSVNPVLAVGAMTKDATSISSGLIQQVIEDGPSPKMLYARDLARSLASEGRKVVIWSIFTDTILQMELLLADLNPVTIYGATPSGEPTDPDTREGKVRRFYDDESCMVLLANPAAAGEGISLHHACHDAIYIDRSYNATHYLQSIDRIHRLGLPENTATNVFILQTMAPKGLGCIDHSVSRRLAKKLRALEQLLDDKDIHQIALDEEEADEPINYDFDAEDLIDLIEELEGKLVYSGDEDI